MFFSLFLKFNDVELQILEYKPLCIQQGFVKKIEMSLVPNIENVICIHYFYKVSRQNLSFPLQIDFEEAFNIGIFHFRSKLLEK